MLELKSEKLLVFFHVYRATTGGRRSVAEVGGQWLTWNCIPKEKKVKMADVKHTVQDYCQWQRSVTGIGRRTWYADISSFVDTSKGCKKRRTACGTCKMRNNIGTSSRSVSNKHTSSGDMKTWNLT